jgi:hypothetical protein
VTDFIVQRPVPASPARVLYAVARNAVDAAGWLAAAAILGAMFDVGPTANLTTWPITGVVLALYGAGHLAADAARHWADWLTRDESTAADDAAAALAQLAHDLGQDADPQLVLAGLRRAHLPGQLANICTAVRDQLPSKVGELELSLAVDQLRYAEQLVDRAGFDRP